MEHRRCQSRWRCQSQPWIASPTALRSLDPAIRLGRRMRSARLVRRLTPGSGVSRPIGQTASAGTPVIGTASPFFSARSEALSKRHVVCTPRCAMYPRAVVLGLSLMAAWPASAANFSVDSTMDAVDANPGDGVCADSAAACTLRAALEETNNARGVGPGRPPGGPLRALPWRASRHRCLASESLRQSGRSTLQAAG